MVKKRKGGVRKMARAKENNLWLYIVIALIIGLIVGFFIGTTVGQQWFRVTPIDMTLDSDNDGTPDYLDPSPFDPNIGGTAPGVPTPLGGGTEGGGSIS